MKKIMFNDKYGLTQAVLEGRKTMTRRLAMRHLVEDENGEYAWDGTFFPASYKVGEIVAVAQSYEDIIETVYGNDELWKFNYQLEVEDSHELLKEDIKGWKNKMFVKADLMPYKIRIKNVRIERLNDISDEDCIREGVIDDCPGVQYSFQTNIGYCGQYPFGTPREAFAALIDKVSGKGTWKINPWVYVYEFELVK